MFCGFGPLAKGRQLDRSVWFWYRTAAPGATFPHLSSMAKQRPKPKVHSKIAAPQDRATARGTARRPSPAAASASASSPSAAPPRRSTYFEAVALYERGLEALQRDDEELELEE